MKLFYYKDEIGNFGDDLNPWLWGKLLPGFFDENEDQWFVGIGTLLNHKLPKNGRKIVFGSGYGYGDLPTLNDDFEIVCVRGQKTAEILGLDCDLAITDPAILVRTIYNVGDKPRPHKFGFIPHSQSVKNFTWDSICSNLGFNYISVEWSVDKILAEMSQCDTLICEAMHGAIVADALGIPWIPVRCYEYIDRFKWNDWLSTAGIPYDPISVNPIFNIENSLTSTDRNKTRLKRLLKKFGAWNSNWRDPVAKNSSQAEIDLATTNLIHASTTRSYLSSDELRNKHIENLLEKLELVKTKIF